MNISKVASVNVTSASSSSIRGLTATQSSRFDTGAKEPTYIFGPQSLTYSVMRIVGEICGCAKPLVLFEVTAILLLPCRLPVPPHVVPVRYGTCAAPAPTEIAPSKTVNPPGATGKPLAPGVTVIEFTAFDVIPVGVCASVSVWLSLPHAAPSVVPRAPEQLPVAPKYVAV